jgi:hypothetical protein
MVDRSVDWGGNGGGARTATKRRQNEDGEGKNKAGATVSDRQQVDRGYLSPV